MIQAILHWITNGRRLLRGTPEGRTLNEVMLAFIQENKGKYEKRGRQKSAQEANFAGVIKLARPLYGKETPRMPERGFNALL